MPRFEPFTGLRYGPDDLSRIVCPPYDVISPPEREALEAQDDVNCVRLELPQPSGAQNRYEAAATLLAQWRRPGGPLVVDDSASFYVYRMDFTDDAGQARQTSGVLGALGLEPPGEGILPHERTTPKDKQDRLDLLRETRTNLSPIWGLSLASGLSALCDMPADPVASASAGGVDHHLWRIADAEAIAAIRATVASQPVVVADGHHRYEVALAYQASHSAAGPHDAVMTYVVELSEDQLAVAPIHRLVDGVALDPSRLAKWFSAEPTDALDASIGQRMANAGALCLVTGAGTWLLRPTPAVINAATMDLDSSRLDVALAEIDGVEVRFQHGWANVAAAVANQSAAAGVLLRPATVKQIAEIAHQRERMPPKTTFFTPKPATGMVFRSFDDQPGSSPGGPRE